MSGHLRARELFAPIAPSYERWARVLSLGQDGRWRRVMVDRLAVPPGEPVLDVAAGTGSITRLLGDAWVVSLDQSPEMLRMATLRGATAVLATAESLPFRDEAFEAVTFGYLLRYVESVPDALQELARVLRPRGRMGMIEFGRPVGAARATWRLYTKGILPLAGTVVGSGWSEVGAFLGPSIEDFWDRFPLSELLRLWEAAGIEDVQVRHLSLGGGLVMWGTKR